MKLEQILLYLLGAAACLVIFLVKVHIDMMDFTEDMTYHMQTLNHKVEQYNPNN